MTTNIVLFNVDTSVDPLEMTKVAAALQRQVNEHFAPEWNEQAFVRTATEDALPRVDEWMLSLFEVPDQPNALGFHDVTPQGLPHLHIFPALDAQDGVPWSVTASHELLEALSDPGCRRASQLDDGTFLALENCDAVENDTYKIDDVFVSNFNTLAYFEPPSNVSGVKFDYMGLVQFPGEVRPGGYKQVWDGSQWNMTQHVEKAPRAARLKLQEMGMTRAARRSGRR